MKFSVYWENEKTADVDVQTSRVYIKRYILHPVKQIFCKDEMTRYELGVILKSRCWDEHRDGLKSYLDKMGLDEFNPYKICRYTHGVMFQDKTWFLFEGENLTWDDVRVKL